MSGGEEGRVEPESRPEGQRSPLRVSAYASPVLREYGRLAVLTRNTPNPGMGDSLIPMTAS